jgi:hypothetical protein
LRTAPHRRLRVRTVDSLEVIDIQHQHCEVSTSNVCTTTPLTASLSDLYRAYIDCLNRQAWA